MEKIGQGRTAEIFLWGEGTVVKLFHSSLHPAVVDSEIRVNAQLRNVALPMPRMLDVVEVEGRRGIIYERVEGETMLQQMMRRPWQVGRFARTLAELHVQMHQVTCDALSSQREYWERKIRLVKQLSEQEKELALTRLRHLPDGVKICHGDFHPDNVMMTARGPVVIDWSNATTGNAAGDVARTAMIFRIGTWPNPLQNVALRSFAKRFHDVYVREYLRLTGLSPEAVQAWELPLYVARLLESPPKAEEELVLRRVGELLKDRTK